MKVGSALVNAGTEFHSFVVPGFVAGEFSGAGAAQMAVDFGAMAKNSSKYAISQVAAPGAHAANDATV